MDRNPALDRLVTAYSAEWLALVDIAVAFRNGKLNLDVDELAKEAKKSTPAVSAKLTAILGALADGVTREQIIERGEKEILSSKAQTRAKKAADGLVNMAFRVKPELKDAVTGILDEWAAAAELPTREDAWDLLISVIGDRDVITLDDIRHFAGESVKKRR